MIALFCLPHLLGWFIIGAIIALYLYGLYRSETFRELTFLVVMVILIGFSCIGLAWTIDHLINYPCP